MRKAVQRRSQVKAEETGEERGDRCGECETGEEQARQVRRGETGEERRDTGEDRGDM